MPQYNNNDELAANSRLVGTTGSERILAQLARRAMLSPWAITNPFRDQGKRSSSGDGKELCDLLVHFDGRIVLFSDKQCVMSTEGDSGLAWARWHARAVDNSVAQLRGATRWLREYPGRVFVDRQCRIPLRMEQAGVAARIHCVAVASGAASHSPIYMGRPVGLRFQSGLELPRRGRAGTSGTAKPFCVSDYDREGQFVHIFDELAIANLLTHLDTIPDFIEYLEARELWLRSGVDVPPFREVDALSLYLKHRHELQRETLLKLAVDNGRIGLGEWEKHAESKRYIEKLKADEISYDIWDYIIEKFAHHARAGEIIGPDGVSRGEGVELDLGLRLMTSYSRFERRLLSDAFLLAMQKSAENDVAWWRLWCPIERTDVAFVFCGADAWHFKSKSEDEYRLARRKHLWLRCSVAAVRFPKAKFVLGLASESLSAKDRSFDMVVVKGSALDEDARTTIRETSDKIGVFSESSIARMPRVTEFEYPD